MKKNNKSTKQIPRSIQALQMILNCKGGVMHDRRQDRGGAKNKQAEFQMEIFDDSDGVVDEIED